jgi:hypothetical protein
MRVSMCPTNARSISACRFYTHRGYQGSCGMNTKEETEMTEYQQAFA